MHKELIISIIIVILILGFNYITQKYTRRKCRKHETRIINIKRRNTKRENRYK